MLFSTLLAQYNMEHVESIALDGPKHRKTSAICTVQDVGDWRLQRQSSLTTLPDTGQLLGTSENQTMPEAESSCSEPRDMQRCKTAAPGANEGETAPKKGSKTQKQETQQTGAGSTQRPNERGDNFMKLLDAVLSLNSQQQTASCARPSGISP